uniref:Ribosomal protein S4 n=1 Tax=Cavenderia fasciculata TaxID=261658 RepID=B2XXA8_CACFS|nr:ribosomal protein S4 [Cavenderia fasciculata]ABX45230.1 ribosomal protein S4 [Cavenderia fasciculata]
MRIKQRLHRFSSKFYIDVYGNIHRKTANITKQRWTMISNQSYLFSGEVMEECADVINQTNNNKRKKKELKKLGKIWKEGQRLYWEIKQIKYNKYKLKYVDTKKYERDSIQKLVFYKRFLHYYKNISIKQFKKLYRILKKKQQKLQKFWEILEGRLDSVLVRSQLVRTMYAARHFIKYKHISVNGKVKTRLNYLIKIGDFIGMRRKKMKVATKIKLFELVRKGLMIGIGPAYLETDFRLLLTTMVYKPKMSEINYVFTVKNYKEFYFNMWKRFTTEI